MTRVKKGRGQRRNRRNKEGQLRHAIEVLVPPIGYSKTDLQRMLRMKLNTTHTRTGRWKA